MAASTPIFLNNVASTISAVASGATTTVTVAAGDGAKFGAVAAGQYIPIVIVDPSTSPETVKEFMWVTGVAGDVLTVTRAAESAATYPAGALAAGLTVAAVASAGAFASLTNSAFGPGTLPTGAIVETITRKLCNTATIAAPTTLRGTLVHLASGTVITSLTFLAGTTALATGTHQWFAVLDTSGKVLAVTSDDTSTTWAANATKTLNLTAPLTVPSTGGYYLTHCVNATTPNTFTGFTNSGLSLAITPFASVLANGGTTGPVAVNTTLTLTSGSAVDYGYAS